MLLLLSRGPVGAMPSTTEAIDDDKTIESYTPTHPPTVINADFFGRAIELSGESAFDDGKSPQQRAVGWMSTFDSEGDVEYTFSDQRYAMVVLFFGLEGESWTTRHHWLNTTRHECSWSPYVVCGGDTKKEVINIDFTDNGLSGKIPREIVILSNLEIMYLANNEMKGPLPKELFSLSHMSILDVHHGFAAK